MKEVVDNYSIWSFNISDFDKFSSDQERMRFLINFAVLAPSSHNSQPWTFSVGRNSIRVSLATERLLSVGDSNNRQALISLGCAVENIIVAADYYGYNSDISLPDSQSILVNLSRRERRNTENHLIFNIARRTVNRSPYLDKKVDDKLLSQIKSLSTDNLSVSIVTATEKKNRLADVALQATSAAMSDKAFREELSRYVISNTSKARVGIPGFNMGFPTPLSYVAPFMLRLFDMSKISNKVDVKLLKETTPHMLVISTKEDDMKDWVNVGRVFQKISLVTTAAGVSVAVWAAPIQIGDYYQRVKKIIDSNFRPQMFFRMGYATNDMGGHSPRLNAGEVIE